MTIALIFFVKFDMHIRTPNAFNMTIIGTNNTFNSTNRLTDENIADLVSNHPFFISIIPMLIFWTLSIGALLFLYECIDPIKKYQYSKAILAIACTEPNWKSEEELWKEYVDELLNIKDAEDLNQDEFQGSKAGKKITQAIKYIIS